MVNRFKILLIYLYFVSNRITWKMTVHKEGQAINLVWRLIPTTPHTQADEVEIRMFTFILIDIHFQTFATTFVQLKHVTSVSIYWSQAMIWTVSLLFPRPESVESTENLIKVSPTPPSRVSISIALSVGVSAETKQYPLMASSSLSPGSSWIFASAELPALYPGMLKKSESEN